MYSVIIQNQKTMELFAQYQPLFADAINGGRIGVCKWIESGTSIDTALPELSNLTDDKEDWRAIIVRYIDDNCMAACSCNPRNPYDFEENKNNSDLVVDSQIPLVRLTHMLGGIPPLEIKFKTEVIKEDHRAPRTVYAPIVDEKRDEIHARLTEKYKFDGKMPSSIIIVSIREKQYVDENISHAWLYHKESDSSEFWKRNHYPSVCRFLVFDFEKQGPIQKDADNFNFWLSLLLLSTNEFDSGMLQAYRLYTINTHIKKNEMMDSFQNLADRLRDTKHSIEKSIKKDIEHQICEEEDLPDYRLDIPVAVKLPKEAEKKISTKVFSLFSRGSSTDLGIWNSQKKAVEDELSTAIRSAERTLDQTADKMRPNCTFDEEEVSALNKYQEEDLLRETNAMYHNIVEIQGRLPNEKINESDSIVTSAKKVRGYLLGRVIAKPAIIALIIVNILVVCSAIPTFVLHDSSWEMIGAVVLAQILCICFAAGVSLIAQKFKLNKLLKSYNQEMKNAFNAVVENASDYSTYMSEIASHARASSYVDLSSQKKHYTDTARGSKYKHIKAINILLGKLKCWSKAYHLDVDFTSKRSDIRMDIDLSVSPLENKTYAIETGNQYEVEVNNSGMNIISPFDFIDKVEILREELYDD